MARVRKRGDPVALLKRRLLLVALLLLSLALGWGVWGAYQKERESARLMREAQLQAADLTKRQYELEATIDTLQTERGKEAALRQGYALAKPGEGLIVIVDKSAPVAPTASSSAFVEWLHATFPWW